MGPYYEIRILEIKVDFLKCFSYFKFNWIGNSLTVIAAQIYRGYTYIAQFTTNLKVNNKCHWKVLT